MKIFARDIAQYPLDKYVGKDVWVKIVISGQDAQFWYRLRKGTPDTTYYAKILEIDYTRNHYIIQTLPISYFDPDSVDHRTMSPYELSYSGRTLERCMRALTRPAVPVDTMTDEELLDYVDQEDE